ncbi:hypothetical protein DsansV1_C19g0157631 [Dioscorea sansibarensis]
MWEWRASSAARDRKLRQCDSGGGCWDSENGWFRRRTKRKERRITGEGVTGIKVFFSCRIFLALAMNYEMGVAFPFFFFF